MKIVIIGTGNTATMLGRKLKAAGHEILQVYGRNSSEASALAYELDTESTNYWNVVNKSADLYLLAVSDIALQEVTAELRLPPESIVVHTAAAVNKNLFSGRQQHYGVFYPLQSLRKESSYLPDMPIVVDAGDAATLETLTTLAASISNNVVHAGDEDRLKMHLAAVFCNNFVNHLLSLAAEYCAKEGLNFSMFLPLVRETVDRLQLMPPQQSQTGPAFRNDTQTIDKHLELLSNYPELQKIYRLLTDSIQARR